MQTVLFTRIGKQKDTVRDDIDSLVEYGIDSKNISVVSPQAEGVGVDRGLVELIMLVGGVCIGLVATMLLVPSGLFDNSLFMLALGGVAGMVLTWLALNPLTDDAGVAASEDALMLAVQVEDAGQERAARRIFSKREDATMIRAAQEAVANAKKRNLDRQRRSVKV